MKCNRCKREIPDGEIYLTNIDDNNEIVERFCVECPESEKSEDDYGMGGDWWKAAGESDDN